jgi:hypothetical protein
MKRRPERSEGSLGTCVPRKNMVELPLRAYFFVAPREERGPSALARLGMTSRDAVPIEVRDASLSLGTTVETKNSLL